MEAALHSPEKPVPQLIVMLTYHDMTVPNAAAVFEQCKDTHAQYWGFKEKGLTFPEMQALFTRMKACGKTTCSSGLRLRSFDGHGLL